ncbi:histidine kinase [Chitinophaga ginsengisoli]|uniref:histidine kinase n=1 Tax=Chitinophaga ginsengisoli TaxID=363837 RepID=UPI000D0CC3A1
MEAQKQVLLQQLQPHFLFNTLSVLKSLIKDNPDEAENYSINLSEFLRYSIQVHKNGLVSVEEELKFTNDYITWIIDWCKRGCIYSRPFYFF